MMKKLTVTLSVILALLLVGNGYYLYELRNRPFHANVLPKEITITNNILLWPHIEDLPNLAIQNQLNQVLQQEADRLTESSKAPQTTTRADYLVTFNKGNILSLSISEFVSPQLAAHPMSYFKAYTMNVHTGKLYQLNDLFKPESNYKERLNPLIQQQINDRNIMFINPYGGIKENDQEFYLTPQSLILFYKIYEYTPYVYGILKFAVPLEQITDILAPDVSRAVKLSNLTHKQ
jgi:hypothetical protein